MGEASQAECVAVLEAGAVEGVGPVARRIDTHISHVFLTPTRAFKLKRAVQLPFVDFSTLEQRRAACAAEIEVNRRFAGDMYLGVRDVRRLGAGHFRLGGGTGEIVDWLVEMHRFDQSDQFDEMARAGRLTPSLLEETADVIAAAHAACEPVGTAGHTADYRAILRELRRTEAHGAAEIGLRPGEPDLFEALDHDLTPLDGLIEARRRDGRVRRTHGDLHLRNICLFRGKPTPFDALEFDARLATTDVLYDLAFLLMDLIRVGEAGGASRVMNRYWDTAGEDEGALALLPFFMALRAGVRMAVDVEAGALETADVYRRLARRLLRRAPPILLAIGGLSGSGKSTIARALAPHLPGPAGARLLRSDVLRKRLQGIAQEARLGGHAAYGAEARAGVYTALFDAAASAHGAGHSVILDATFQDKHIRQALSDRLGKEVPCLWLDVPQTVRLERVGGRSGDASDADIEVARSQAEPRALAPQWQRIDGRGTPAEIVSAILGTLGRGD